MGYEVGRNVRTELRWANGEYGKLPELAGELARLPVDVLAAPGGDPAAHAAKAATSTIPIVFMVGSDPAKSGLVVSLNRPGYNATGLNIFTLELGSKRLQLLRDLLGRTELIGILVNSNNPNASTDANNLQDAARTLGQKVAIIQASTAEEIDKAFATFAAELKVTAVLVNSDPFYLSQRDQLAALAIRYSLPAIYSLREHVAAGGLMSYGTDLIDAYRQLGAMAGRVLRGSKPNDIPVEQPTKYNLVINVKAAKALGITVPQTLLATADEVIE
jgi:putative ABC transport system substrate-binding protein